MLTSTPVSVSVSSCEEHRNPERCGNIRGIESFLHGRWIESFLYRALVQENLQLQKCQNLPALALCLKRLCLLEPCVRALKCGRLAHPFLKHHGTERHVRMSSATAQRPSWQGILFLEAHSALSYTLSKRPSESNRVIQSIGTCASLNCQFCDCGVPKLSNHGTLGN